MERQSLNDSLGLQNHGQLPVVVWHVRLRISTDERHGSANQSECFMLRRC